MLGGAPTFHAFLELFRPLLDPLITQLLDRYASRHAHTAMSANVLTVQPLCYLKTTLNCRLAQPPVQFECSHTSSQELSLAAEWRIALQAVGSVPAGMPAHLRTVSGYGLSV